MEVVQEKRATIAGVEISYYQSGRVGPAVVLLHGGGTDSAMLSWREALPDLSDRFRVYAPNWPGYGNSQMIDSPYSLERLSSLLNSLMDVWEINHASLVGLLMGGGAAIDFALRYPQRIKKLVLVDPYGIQKRPPNYRRSFLSLKFPIFVNMTWQSIRKDKGMVRAVLKSIFANPENVREDLVDELFNAVQTSSAQQAFSSFQQGEFTWSGLRTCYLNRLSEIQAPTLFIHGDHNQVVTVDEVQRAASLLENASVKVMEDTARWPPREHPSLFSRLVKEFLLEDPNA